MKEFKTVFFEKIKDSDFDPGYFSAADEYLEMFIEKNGPICFKWIYELYREHYDDEEFIIGLLKTLTHILPEELSPECVNIAKESLKRESSDIKESSVRAFENWEYTDAIPFLEEVQFNDSFLDDYLWTVIHDLKGIKIEKDKVKTQ
jgi:hypothetical protein